MRNFLVLGLTITLFAAVQAQAKTCVFIDSYHTGYGWSDGIYKGLSENLKGACELKMYQMDTKRNKDKAFMKKAVAEAKQFIEDNKADVVIMADDNATRELLVPHYKNSKTPVVFCGLNWSIDKYGLPFKNTTGMIEVAPIKQVVEEMKKNNPGIKTVGFLGSDVATEHKAFKWQKEIFEASGLKVTAHFAKDFADWKKRFKEVQSQDVVFLNNNAGINDWNVEEAKAFVKANMKKVSATVQEWMIPYATFAMPKSAYEQGEWSAKAAKKILKGKKPNRIAVTTNRKYEPLVNPELLKLSNTKLSAEFLGKATKYDSKKPASK